MSSRRSHRRTYDDLDVLNETFASRSAFVSLFLVVILVLVIVALCRVVFFVYPAKSAVAEQSHTSTTTIYAHRGTIYDRHGNVLAMSEDCSMICCNPSQIQEPYVIANILVDHLGGDADTYVGKLMGTGSFAYVVRKIDVDDATAIMHDILDNHIIGVWEQPDMRRVYPYGSVGSQVLGIVGADGHGMTGLELYYDNLLCGVNGEQSVEVGNGGVPIADAVAEVTPAVDGTDIVISLDVTVQRKAESVILDGVDKYKAESGSVVVVEPSTGEILAACSTPFFDIGDLSYVPEGATSLKCVSSAYEPGSIFKILTAAIAIDSGSMRVDERFSVPAQVLVGEDYVSDVDGRDYTMEMDLREILRRSSNVGAAVVAQDRIGVDSFAMGISEFGVGSLTGIDYPGEIAGIVHSKDEYDGSTLGSMAFGQGLSIPAIQMVRAVSAVAEKGLMTQPHFLVQRGVEKVSYPRRYGIISAGTAEAITDMLCEVIDNGTGIAAQIDGYQIAGKTGTGEQSDLVRGGYSDDGFMSSLIGYAPADDPSVLVYVGLNGTPYHASDSSASLFADIMHEALLCDREFGEQREHIDTVDAVGDDSWDDSYDESYYDSYDDTYSDTYDESYDESYAEDSY